MNGISLFFESGQMPSPSLQLFTDAAGSIGFGGYLAGQRFHGHWLPEQEINKTTGISIAWQELYPIYLACCLWGSQWTSKRSCRSDFEPKDVKMPKNNGFTTSNSPLHAATQLYVHSKTCTRPRQWHCSFALSFSAGLLQTISVVDLSSALRHPVIDDPNLKNHVRELIQNSWASSTKHTYASGIKQFILFCLSKGIVTPRSPLLPATEITLLYFMEHLSKTVSYATVKTYMASILYLHVIFQIPFNMGRMQLLEKCLKGLKCLKGEKLRDRQTITVTELEFLHAALRPQFTDSVDNVMLWAAFTLAFFGFLQCSEFTCNSLFDQTYDLSRTDIIFHPKNSTC